MKKYFYLLLSLIIFSCATEDDFIEHKERTVSGISAKDDITPVHLIKAWTAYGNYRGFTTYSKKFTVKVANLGFDKTVSVFHKKTDGNWEEIQLSYDFNIDDENEIWVGNLSTSTQVYDDEFVIKYEVNGTTYWDNNRETNYAMSIQEGYFFADPNLNVSVDKDYVSVSYNSYYDQNSMFVTVDIRNLAPSKEVGVVYTTDGWQTQGYFSLGYRPFWNNGPLFLVESPNNFGIERWTGNVQIDKSIDTVEYAIIYRVNGLEYWDNNYGKNYTVTKKVYNW
ncbi:carbohydrate-binding protein [Aquimarina algiphila]|uniref:carbohydrate-binding protein n=1 Tax=Aquimarina algiphila TaxID=2047982 RepID=UPI002490C595|nr:carbohydrate-binding protein [Aquimarina algiphila]